MSNKTMKKAYEIADIMQGSWSDLHKNIVAIDLEENEFKKIFTEEKYLSILFSDSRNRSWYFRRVIEALVPKFPHVSDYIIEKCKDDTVVFSLLQGGFYSDISMLNKAALWEDMPDAQAFAASLCDVKTLKKIISSKNSKVRTIVFERLGPVECLDEMLNDSIAKNREMGARYAPYCYAPLAKMTNELARSVFGAIVLKIDIQYLPMMLANRNIKNNWQARMIEERLTRGY